MRWLGLLSTTTTAALVGACDPSLGAYPDATEQADSPPRIIDAPYGDAACVNATPVDNLPTMGGHHYAGQGCTYGCHQPGSGMGLDLHFGGTIYVNFAGQAPRPGVNIHVQDAMGRKYTVTSQDNGNFFLPASVGPLDFPLKSWASACPQVEEMILAVPQPGNCNDPSLACHPNNMRIRLPQL